MIRPLTRVFVQTTAQREDGKENRRWSRSEPQMVCRCERAGRRLDVGGESGVYFPVSHLRMCPGMERLLRPRWFTAWTIILPVQLTLP